MKPQWLVAAALAVQVCEGQSTNGLNPSVTPEAALDDARLAGIHEGRKEAEDSFRRGTLVIIAVGRDTLQAEDEYVLEKYHVRTYLVTNRTENLLDWTGSYNARMRELLQGKYGTNIFEEAERTVTERNANRAQHLSLTNCAPIGWEYGIATYLKVAKALQAMGQTNAIRRLEEWATDRGKSEQVIILCRMLFEKTGGGEFRRPMIGGASFLGGTSYGDWPLEPIALQNGIPILITDGYMGAGSTESGAAYLHYCVKNCRWSSAQYAQTNAEGRLKAVEDLMTATNWQRPLRVIEQDFLRGQAELRREPYH